MANQVVKVRRDTIASCMTCPICNNLLRDATTISECLHAFCRKCIHEKISEDEIECCPICNTDLGGTPLEKLRPDHNLQDLRARIFPFKRRKVKAHEIVTSFALPARRKERSISSLVVSTPRVSAHAGMTGRRTKATTRKDLASRGIGSSGDKTIKKEDDSGEDHPRSTSSPETLNKFTHNKRQFSSSAEAGRPVSNKDTNDGAEPWDTKQDLWKPLNFLVEVANRTKSSKSASQGSDSKSEPMHIPENEAHTSKTKSKENKRKSKAEDENNAEPSTSENVTPKRLRRTRRKRSGTFGESIISPQAMPEGSSAKRERRKCPVWFSLMASEEQEGEAPLPQIPASFLRIRDGNVPVSFIQKYLMKKLDLTDEAEIEIRCMGQPVVPTLQLHNLIDLWLQTAAKHQRISASIGASAKDFVMVLAYSRKVADK